MHTIHKNNIFFSYLNRESAEKWSRTKAGHVAVSVLPCAFLLQRNIILFQKKAR